MNRTAAYRILGALGSPYSMKMRAILRYRRLPYSWVQLNAANEAERDAVRPAVIPVIQYPDGTYHNDSTPMIHDLEARHPGQRSIVPPNPAHAFLAALLEDMGDEWATKVMFHYRWRRERDQAQMSEWLAYYRAMGGGYPGMKAYAEAFRARQVGRMPLVGCTEENTPLIEDTARRLCAMFESHVVEQPFFFGSRPSLAEFSWYGQFSQLIVDPTPNDLLREIAPFTVRWLMQVEDLSGWDGEWADPDAPLPPIIDQLLAFAADVYFPFLEANARAVAEGVETFTVELLGQPYSQGAFKYQVRCLKALKQAYADLAPAVRASLTPRLESAGLIIALTAA